MTPDFEGSGWGFGYQANVGVAYEIVDAVALTLGYKFFGTLETQVTDAGDDDGETTTCTSSRPCWRTAPSWASASGSRRSRTTRKRVAGRLPILGSRPVVIETRWRCSPPRAGPWGA